MARSKILVCDDERMIRWSIQQALTKEGHTVLTVETGEEALAIGADESPDLYLLDITLPGIDGVEVLRRLKERDSATTVVMVTALDDVKIAVDAMRLGAYDFVSKPFDIDRLKILVQNALERHELSQAVDYHRKDSVRRYGFHRIVRESRKLMEVVDLGMKVAQSNAATVLVTGESGTGKDLLAQAIHFESNRAGRPFIPINCTALPEELLESELMGHERGAFTDAKSAKKGLFEVADGGTVFLDEIGDMKPGLQAKLLRFIENKTFRRVGGHKDIQVDVRIVAATNRDLDAMVHDGRFREDLFFRLNVIPIHIPPLRDRREDILPLAGHFLDELAKDCRRAVSGFTDAARRAMFSYDWPGNVRELRNLIERSMILGAGEQVSEIDLFGSGTLGGLVDSGQQEPQRAIEGQTSLGDDAAGLPPVGPRFRLPPAGIDIEEVEKEFIAQAIAMTNGNQTKAAERLCLTRDALRYRMKKFGL